MDAQPDTRPMTTLLKGFAILAVAANHFITLYVAPACNDYGNGFIAFFFIFSGYGLYHSLVRCGRLSAGRIFGFWVRRFVRIYPLYRLSLALLSTLDHQSYTVRVFLAYPLRQAPGIFWFVTSIVQCYLLAPLLFWLLTLPLFLAACAAVDRSLNAVVDCAAAVLAKRGLRPKPATPGR
jgi:hypothetical protein